MWGAVSRVVGRREVRAGGLAGDGAGAVVVLSLLLAVALRVLPDERRVALCQSTSFLSRGVLLGALGAPGAAASAQREGGALAFPFLGKGPGRLHDGLTE